MRRRRRLVREAGGVADAGFAGDGGDGGNDGDSGGDGGGVGRYASAGRRRDLASRFSSRSIVSLCGSFDFPVSACGWDACAVFVSLFSYVIRWRLVVSFSFSSRPSSRLSVLWGVSYIYSLRLASRPVLLINSIRQRLVRRLIIPSRLAVRLLRLVLFVSFWRLVKQPVFSFRLGGSWGGAGSPSHSFFVLVLFVRCVSWLWGWAAVRFFHTSWWWAFSLLFLRHRGVAVGGMVMPFNDTRGALFYSARFPRQGGDEMMMMIWIRSPQYGGNGGTAAIWG